MGWFKVDDNFFENFKVEIAGDDAAHLHLRGIAYCSRNQTDGRIPFTTVPKLWIGRGDVDELIERLIDAGLWKKNRNHYAIHDYLEHQSSRAQIRNRKAKNAGRQKAYRDRNGVTESSRNEQVCAPDTESDTDTESDVEAERITTGEELRSLTASTTTAVEELLPDEVDPEKVRELFGGIGRAA